MSTLRPLLPPSTPRHRLKMTPPEVTYFLRRVWVATWTRVAYFALLATAFWMIRKISSVILTWIGAEIAIHLPHRRRLPILPAIDLESVIVSATENVSEMSDFVSANEIGSGIAIANRRRENLESGNQTESEIENENGICENKC